jgi:CDP-diacylglycerol--glycerol-3-phosphate 3-phosphatidyltransferase
VTAVSTSGLRSARVVAVYTWLRILLTPVTMVLLMADGGRAGALSAAALAVFALAALTDCVDGILARRWDVTTTLGSFLDTTADKLLVTGVLFALVAVERASPWIAALIVGREVAILGLRGVVAAEGTVMAPSRLGKLKTLIQFVAISLAIVRLGDPVGGLYVDEWVMLVAAVITAVSAVDYLSKFASSLSSTPVAPRGR